MGLFPDVLKTETEGGSGKWNSAAADVWQWAGRQRGRAGYLGD